MRSSSSHTLASRWSAVYALGLLSAPLLGYLIARHGIAEAAVLLALPVFVWTLARPHGGLAVGTVLILVAPYWQTLGSSQITVLRVASLAAALSVMFAGRLRWRATDVVLMMFLLILVAGWLLQYDHPGAGRVLSIELTPIGFYVGARAVPADRVPAVMLTVLLAGAAGALTVLYEYALGHPVFIDPAHYVWNATDSTIFRPGGVFGSPPGASTVLCVVILFGLPVVSDLRGRSKAMASFCVVICALALIATFTRAGLIAAAVGALFYLWLLRSPLLRPTRVLAAALTATALLIVFLPSLSTNTTFQQGVLRAGTFAARESYWQQALPIATANAHSMLFGIGTSSLEASSYSPAAPVPVAVATAPVTVTHSLHNEYVTTLVEQGILGLAVLVALLMSTGAAAARTARRSANRYVAAVAASIAAFAVVSTADTTLVHGPSFAMLMVAIGLSGVAAKSPTVPFAKPPPTAV